MFLTVEEIMAKTGNYAAIQLDYNAVRTAVDSYLNQENVPIATNTIRDTLPNKLTAQTFRKIITESKAVQPSASFFWRNRYNYNIDKNNWLMGYSSTQEERLRLLQWKILHNIYPTNILLQKMGIRINNLCDSCLEVDVIEHFFWRCKKLKQFWKNVENAILSKTGSNIIITEKVALFGYEVNNMKTVVNKTINHIILIAKMTISKFKYGKALDINCMFDSEMFLRIP